MATEDQKKTPRDRVFGVLLSNGVLLYETLKSNPSKALRALKRLGGIPDDACLVEFSMRRKREAGDVRGLTMEQLKKREPYVGPMR